MLKFVILALFSAAFAGAAETQTDNDYGVSAGDKAKLQETLDKYREAYVKLTGLQASNLRKCNSDDTVAPSDIKFYFYRLNEVAVRNVNSQDMPPNSIFNASLETKVYVPGYLEPHDDDMFTNISMQHAVRNEKVNLVVVNWQRFAFCSNWYIPVADHVNPQIANYITQMLKILIQNGANEKRIHLIGYGAGAHLAGLAGKGMGPSKVGRITGLSPSGGYFNYKPETMRLAKGDADFVDVIHTNMGVFGINKIIGDLDFLPQGGRIQPVAERHSQQPENKQFDLQILKHLLSHQAARKYYRQSIGFGFAGFIGKVCDTWGNFVAQKCALNQAAVMGEHVSKEVNGVVFLSVNDNSPYSRGLAGAYSGGQSIPKPTSY